jgi:uncharacterized protein YecE (DUF72 family)
VDSTFYHAPSSTTVTGWARKTPDNFVLALKVPQSITHEKVLVDCDDEFKNFVSVAELLTLAAQEKTPGVSFRPFCTDRVIS